MKTENFDYYIYLDYSDNLIGYIIIEKSQVGDLLPKIRKFHHYKNIKYKKEYISSIRKVFASNKILSNLLKHRIKDMRDNLVIFIDVIEFVNTHTSCMIFASIDNNQYNSFVKLLHLISNKDNVSIIRESDLKKGSFEYRLSLIIDTMLNIERRKKTSK